MGRMAGTGTAVSGMGTNELGCQLRWRFFGGPEFMAEDTEHPRTDKESDVRIRKTTKEMMRSVVRKK